ncbi:hypothetical protein GY45DRAFT_407101 [Cubamyces sp. BRFM 1775]|nr:hypothetical protein GY45DRAFT_407101 [Cubamyces sp. BRFM 1775]
MAENQGASLEAMRRECGEWRQLRPWPGRGRSMLDARRSSHPGLLLYHPYRRVRCHPSSGGGNCKTSAGVYTLPLSMVARGAVERRRVYAKGREGEGMIGA